MTEANVYYSANTGIGYHGDAERNIVIGANLGDQRTIMWQEYHRFEPVGEPFRIKLEHGDMYLMNAKAAGSDWRKSTIHTFRHRAGDETYLIENDKVVRRMKRKRERAKH